MTNPDFTHELLLDAIRKIDQVSQKVDTRVDELRQTTIEMHKDLRDAVKSRLDPLEKRVEDHTIQLSQHQHNFAIMGFFFSGALAVVSVLSGWLQSLFHSK